MAAQGAVASATGYERQTIGSGTPTRFGRIDLAGEVCDAEPRLARRLRVLDGLVISVVLAGVGTFRWHDGSTTPIEAPMITIALPGEPHWYGTEPERRWTEWYAVVRGPIFELIVQRCRIDRSGPRRFSTVARPGDLAQIVGERAQPAAAEEQVWTLAHWLADALRDTDSEVARLDRARQLLTDDLAAPVRMQSIAEEIEMGYETFRRRFKAQFGQSPLAYRNDQRLTAAARLLRLTTLSCRDVAERLGYADEFHLSRRFSRRFGRSPTQYRTLETSS